MYRLVHLAASEYRGHFHVTAELDARIRQRRDDIHAAAVLRLGVIEDELAEIPLGAEERPPRVAHDDLVHLNDRLPRLAEVRAAQ